MEQTHQQVGRRDRRPDQFKLFNRVQQNIRTGPVFTFFGIQQIGSIQQTVIARSTFAGHMRRGFGHLLKHHATRTPGFCLTRQCRFAKGQRKPRWQLFGLCKIGFGTGGQATASDGCDPLIRLGAFALVDQDSKIALADFGKGIDASDQAILVKRGIGTNAANLTLFFGGVVIGRDQACWTIAANLQRQLPAEFDGLTDQGR